MLVTPIITPLAGTVEEARIVAESTPGIIDVADGGVTGIASQPELLDDSLAAEEPGTSGTIQQGTHTLSYSNADTEDVAYGREPYMEVSVYSCGGSFPEGAYLLAGCPAGTAVEEADAAIGTQYPGSSIAFSLELRLLDGSGELMWPEGPFVVELTVADATQLEGAVLLEQDGESFTEIPFIVHKPEDRAAYASFTVTNPVPLYFVSLGSGQEDGQEEAATKDGTVQGAAITQEDADETGIEDNRAAGTEGVNIEENMDFTGIGTILQADAEDGTDAASPETGAEPSTDASGNALVYGILTAQAGEYVAEAEGAFPEGAVLVAEELPCKEFDIITGARAFAAFDVKVVAGGEKFEPDEYASVSIRICNDNTINDDMEIEALHVMADADDYADAGDIAEALDGGEVMSETIPAETMDGTAGISVGGFSVFVFYTVEFHYDGYEYVLDGNGSVPVANVAAAVGITDDTEAFNRNIRDVAFSNSGLVSATCEEGTWMLASLAPFSTEEMLTITMEGGGEYAIMVTDTAEDGTAFVSDEAVITGMIVNTIADGSGVWDADDGPGNDSGNNNRIVRTFDTIRYSVEYTINMRPESTYTGFEDAWVYVDLSIPGTANDYEFVTGDMPWLEDAVVSASGGVLHCTGRTYITSNEGINPIPGTQGFTVVLKPLGIKNGTAIQPTFSLWLDGNPDADKYSLTCDDANTTLDNQPCTVYASCAAKLDILTKVSSYNSVLYADTAANTIGTSSDYGALGLVSNYSVMVMLNNDSVQKGLMGLEVPEGPIEYDITVESDIKPKSGTKTVLTEAAELWDYRISNYSGTGNLGRNMAWDRYSHMPNESPRSNNATHRKYVTKSGSYTVTQTGENTFHVICQDYKIDSHFPDQNYGTKGDAAVYEANEGIFTAMKIQFFTPIEASLAEETTYHTKATASNLSATSKSGDAVASETRTNNNTGSATFTRRPSGTFSKYIYIVNPDTYAIPYSPSSTANYVRSLGQEIAVDTGFASGTGNPPESTIYAADSLIKFDGEAFRPNGKYYQTTNQFMDNVPMDARLIYAAKPDGTNWEDEDEMQGTRITDMVFYATLEELEASGATCTGVLLEQRGGTFIPGSRREYTHVSANLDILNTAKINYVHMFTNDVYLYYQDTAGEWTSDNTILTDGFVEADYTMETWGEKYGKYQKSVFDEYGTFVQNHSSVNTGVSLYIAGETNTVTKGFDQLTATSGTPVEKSNYNLNYSERTVDYYIQPQVTSTSDEPAATTVTVTDVLPEHISYIAGSAVLGGTYNQESGEVEGGTACEPQVTYDESTGETTLVWVFENVVPNTAMDKIHYSATIGDVSDPDNDVDETMNPFTTQTRQASTYGTPTAWVDTSLNIIKSVSTTISKQVDHPVIEKNGEITYTVIFGNSSVNNTRPFDIFDVMPYDGDARGSHYDGTLKTSTVAVDKASGEGTLGAGIHVYYTTDMSIRGMDNNAKTLAEESITWTEAASTETADEVVYAINAEATGLRVSGGSLYSFEALKLEIRCVTSANNASDLYVNNTSVYADRFADTVFSSRVRTTVVDRKVSGTVFFDVDKTGTLTDGDERLQGIRVSLRNTDGTPARDSSGGLIADAYTDSEGVYEFAGFAPGDYYVEIVKTGQIDSRWKECTRIEYTSPSQAGTLPIDSDAVADGTLSKISDYYSLSNGTYTLETLSFQPAEALRTASQHLENLNAGYMSPDVYLDLSMDVEGNMASRDKYFAFTVELENIPEGGEILVSYDSSGTPAGNADQSLPANPTPSTTVITEDVTQPAAISRDSDGKATFTIYLAHGQNVGLVIPAGTKYTITDGNEDYRASFTATGDTTNATEGDIASGDTNSITDQSIDEDAAIHFLNVKNGVIPTSAGGAPTGLAFAAGLAALLLIAWIAAQKRSPQQA